MVQLYRRKGAEFLANSVIEGDQLAPKLVALAGGGFVAIWTDASGQTDASGTGIIGQRFDAAGNKVGEEILVNTGTAGDQGEGSVTALANGGFLVSWTDGNGTPVQRAQMFDAGGAKVGAALPLETGSPFPESVQVTGLSGGGFAAISFSGYGQVYDAAGAKVGAAFDASGAATFNGTAAAAAPGGGFIVVGRLFGAPGDFGAQLFDAAGAKVGALTLLDTPSSSHATIAIAALAGGGYAMTWQGDGDQIYALVLAADGTQIGGQIAVTADFDWEHSEPSIAARPDGGFVVAWTKESIEGTAERLVVAQIYDAAGLPDGTFFLVSAQTDHPNQNHGQSSIAMLPSGDLVVAWHGAGPGDERSPGSIYPNIDGGIRVQIFGEVETPVLDILTSTDSVNEIAVENTAVLQLSTDSEAVNSGHTYTLLADSTGGGFRIDGDMLVVADTLLLDHETAANVSVTVRVTDINGNMHDETFVLSVTDAAVERRLIAGDEVAISDTQNWSQSRADVAALASGGYVVTWTDGSHLADGTGSAIKAQIFTSAGVALGNEFVVNTQTSAIQEDAAVTALASGGFAVTWYDNGVIKAQILDAGGTKVGGEIGVSAAGGGSIHQWADIDSVADGGFVVAWMASGAAGDGSGQAIRMQLFDTAGAKVGGEQIVNTATDGDQTDVAVAGLGGGGFVATWTDNGSGGDDSSNAVMAQIFDAAGAKVGGEILVNSVTFRSQADPAVVALGSGRFVVTWTDTSDFPAAIVIKAQIFAADGTRIAGEIVVTPDGGGLDSSVTALADGGFAVSWFTDYGDLGAASYAHRAQLFDLNGHKIGGDFEISRDAGIPTQDQSGLAGLAGGGLVATWADDSGPPINDIMTRLYVPPPLSVPGPPIVGTAGMDLLVGTQSADVIQGLDGIDRLDGREGDDTLEGGEGNDTLIAGLGDDLLYGGAGRDLLIGGEDDDALYGEDGDDTLIYHAFVTGNFVALLDGGIGDDELSFLTFGFDAAATLTGGDGNDTITSFGGEHVAIDAGAGSDFVYLPNLGSRFDISLGADRDLLQLVGYPDSFVPSAGTNVSDFAVGDGGDQLALAQYLTIFLLGWDRVANPFATGHLALIQRGADAVIRLDRDGAAGGDHVLADLVVLQNVAAASLTVRNIGFAADGSATPGMTIDGTADLDLLAGGGGDDLVRGLGGNDRLLGGAGDDRLEGGAGMDSLTGDVGDDLLYGGDDQDIIGDSHGNDQMFGEGGDDFILVDRQYLTGAATIVLADGGAGNDNLTFFGRLGLVVDDVTLIGGAGEDLITVYGGGAVIIDGGDGPEIITIDVTASSYRITFGADPFSSDILRLAYVPSPLTSFTVVDFTTGNGGDMIEMETFLQSYLLDWEAANPFGTGHLLLGQNGADALILVDRNGGGDNYAVLGTLENVDAAQLTELNLGFLPGPVARVGTSGNDSLTGTAGGDHILGFSGNDFINGLGGADEMEGGGGDDVYVVDNGGDAVIERADEGNDVVYALVSYQLTGGSEIETLAAQDNGATTALALIGNEFANAIYGNNGANHIDGNSGADALAGFGGNDAYVVDDVADRVFEDIGRGIDIVYATTSFALGGGSEIETLAALDNGATTALALVGNEFANTIYGNNGANHIDGNAGADALVGFGGNDAYVVDDVADRVFEDIGRGNDIVYATASFALGGGSEIETLAALDNGATTALALIGNEVANTVSGNNGANFLDGGLGADILTGFGGDDIYAVDNAGDVVVEQAGGGNDTIYTTFSYQLGFAASVEMLASRDNSLTVSMNLIGNEVANTVSGNNGANFLDGGLGADILTGFGGDDIYAVDNAGDVVVEQAGGGNDTIYTTFSYQLGFGASVEMLASRDNSLTVAMSLTGNELNNVILGNNGANFIDGNSGADVLAGYGGDDVYAVDNAGDQVFENAGGGNDSVSTTVSFTLGAGQEIEVLAARDNSSTTPLNLTGNTLANTILGNNGANVIDGGAGADALVGYGGADTFAFTTALGGGNVDTIHDFVHGTDKIALDDAVFTAIGGLGTLNANAFATGTAAGDADDRIIYNSATGALLYDADGNGAGAAVQFASLSTGLALTASDFQVI